MGRPSIGKPIRDLIQTMARANSLWRAPRIHGELLKLGIKISERTVSRILRTVKRPPSQSWKTFLQNHLGEIVAIDFFTVPTVRMRVLFVFIVLEHQRRKVLQFGVTEHPTAEWVGQQVVEAFAEREAPRYLIRDRDASYGNEFRRRVQSLGVKEVITAPRSPWQIHDRPRFRRVGHAESIGHRGEAKAAIPGLAAQRRSNQPQTHAT